MIEIVQNGNPVLRKKAREIPISDIKTPKIQKVIKDMMSALHGEDDGVAIAAPQIGVPLRIFVVNGRIFDENFVRGKKEGVQKFKDLIFINPIFKKISKDRK